MKFPFGLKGRLASTRRGREARNIKLILLRHLAMSNLVREEILIFDYENFLFLSDWRTVGRSRENMTTCWLLLRDLRWLCSEIGQKSLLSKNSIQIICVEMTSFDICLKCLPFLGQTVQTIFFPKIRQIFFFLFILESLFQEFKRSSTQFDFLRSWTVSLRNINQFTKLLLHFYSIKIFNAKFKTKRNV